MSHPINAIFVTHDAAINLFPCDIKVDRFLFLLINTFNSDRIWSDLSMILLGLATTEFGS